MIIFLSGAEYFLLGSDMSGLEKMRQNLIKKI